MVGTAATSIEDRATDALREAYGADAEFRPGQLEAISALVGDRRRCLVVQRTGWGKSAVYFIATRLMRDLGSGPTLIVSPLLALMRDQIQAAGRLGLTATTLNSSNSEDWDEVENAILAGSADLLLVAPERFNNPRFRENVLGHLLGKAGLLVIDEAHCISDWGHDFRPDYRRLARVAALLPAGVPVLATTATANHRVVADIEEQLGPQLLTLRGSLSRQSLELSALRLDSQSARLAWLAKIVPELPGTGIVYTLTVRDAKRLSRWFNAKGISALAYDGSMENAERLEVEDALRSNAVKVVCSTSALGMGFDKPDLSFVIHFQSPGSPVSYYQQVGRAGRAIEHATGVLLAGEEDQNIWDYFLQTSLPVQAQANEVVGALAREADWMTIGDLEAVVNLRRSRLEGLLKVLEVEGAVEKERGRYRRTLARWTFDAARFARVRALREAEQAAMREYAGTRTCRMRFLQGQLDDDNAVDCGRCDNCLGQPLTAAVTAAELSEASRFLRNTEVVIEPRKVGVARDCLVEQGAALCTLSDGGWGDSVLDAKRAQRLPKEDMLEAFAERVRRWSPQPRPTWITYIPGLDPHRQLVRDLAQDLGRRLQLPVRPAVVKVRVTEPQKLMQNSKQQAANIRGAYRVETALISTDPVLLVDDIVDSRWTMAVVGEQLREAGSGPVFPVALAGSF